MIRILFSSVSVLHGLIHVTGFTKAWSPDIKNQLTGRTWVTLSNSSVNFAGVMWMLICMLLLISFLVYLSRKDWFWIPSAIALLLSQTLIILYWNDAKYVTLVNVIILIVIIAGAATMQFNAMVKKEVKTILATDRKKYIITEKMIKRLPHNVQKWMQNSGIIGKPVSNIVHVAQRGEMRSKPDGKWMTFEAEQYFSIDPPAFIWTAKMHMGLFMDVAARDKYQNGQGNMLIKPLYIYTLSNSSGEYINQGTLVRYLAEIAWFPQAAIAEYISWKNIDDYHALATMSYGDVTASGIYSFDEDGHVTGFEAQRYGEFDGEYRKEKWVIMVKSQKRFNETTIGNKSEVTWKLRNGDFTWLKIQLVSVEQK